MFTNTTVCTVWEKTVQNRSPTYVRHETGAVYWEDTHGQTTGKSRSPEDKAFISVHASELGSYLPKPDDRIIRGYSGSESPVPSALTITAVMDLRYGSPAVQHVEITAK